jgi:hypothetical protein
MLNVPQTRALLLPCLDELIEVPDVEQEFPKVAILSTAPPIGWQGKGHGPESSRLHHVTEGEQADPQVPRGHGQGEQPRKGRRPQPAETTNRRAGKVHTRVERGGPQSLGLAPPAAANRPGMGKVSPRRRAGRATWAGTGVRDTRVRCPRAKRGRGDLRPVRVQRLFAGSPGSPAESLGRRRER